MSAWFDLRAGLAALFVLAAILKLLRPRGLAIEYARTLGLGVQRAYFAAALTLLSELVVAVGLLLTPTEGIAAAFVWVTAAVAYHVLSMARGSQSCGCLGGFDPLRRLGAARRFVYLAPIAALTVLIAAHHLTVADVPATFVVEAALLAAVAGSIALGLITVPSARIARGQTTSFESRRGFLLQAGTLALGILLVPFLRITPALADTCGAWVCRSVWQICGCCRCVNNTSCSSCYRLKCRTCYGPYGSYQECAYFNIFCCGICYADYCVGCGTGHLSSCATC